MKIKATLLGLVLAGLLSIVGVGAALADQQASAEGSGRTERGASFVRSGWGEGRGLAGEVTAVNGLTVTLSTRDGERTVRLSDATEVREGRAAADRSAITVGDRVKVQGQADAQGVIAAERVTIGDDCQGPGNQPTTPSTTGQDGV